MENYIKEHIERSIETKQKVIENCLADIACGSQCITEAYRLQKKLLCCGNGGSAGDAQHIATELIIRYTAAHERPSLAALSLATDTSALTAAGNDFGFDYIFSRQIEGLGQKGDVLLAITTSGNSRNIIEVFKEARKKEMTTLLLTGVDGGKILNDKSYKNLVDVSICVPGKETARIQEGHIMIGQILCAVVEKELYAYDD